MTHFGDNVKRIRLEKRMTQLDLARGIGVDISAISKRERSGTPPLPKTVTTYAKALGVEPADLIRDCEMSIRTVLVLEDVCPCCGRPFNLEAES